MCLMYPNVVRKDSESLASEIANSLQEVITKRRLSHYEVSAKLQPPVELESTPPTELKGKEDQIDGVCICV